MIEGFAAEKSLTGWDHPKLIRPAIGFQSLANKRKASYRISDINELLFRLREVSFKVDIVTGLESISTGTMRSTLSAYYDKTSLLVDVFSGRIPTYRMVEDPRVCDIWVNPLEAKRRAWSFRAIALAKEGVMLQSRPINNMLETFWGAGNRLGVKESRNLRNSAKIRFETEEILNKVEKRFHTHYRYSVRDCLYYMFEKNGKCGLDDVDFYIENSS